MRLIHYTDRLTLNVLDSRWAPGVCQFYKENQEYFEPFEPKRVPNFYTVDFHRANLSYEYDEFIHFRHLRLFLFEQSHPNRIIGSICFSDIRKGSFLSCSLGYKVDHRYQNRGYATEALAYAIRRIIFGQYGLHRIEAYVLPANLPSLRVMEKLGFEEEGIAKDYAFLGGRWENHVRYALIHSGQPGLS